MYDDTAPQFENGCSRLSAMSLAGIDTSGSTVVVAPGPVDSGCERDSGGVGVAGADGRSDAAENGRLTRRSRSPA